MGRLAFGGGIQHTELHVCLYPEISHVAGAETRPPCFQQLSKPCQKTKCLSPRDSLDNSKFSMEPSIVGYACLWQGFISRILSQLGTAELGH